MVQILYYLRDTAKSSALQRLCKSSGLSCSAFHTSDAGKTIASLLQSGISVQHTTGTAIPLLWQAPEFILICGLPRQQMEAFLDSCGAAGISHDVLKAVVTPFNAAWTVYSLLTQLQSEHSMLMK